MSNTRATGKSLLPVVNPEALLRTANAERRRLAKISAISSDSSIHVPSPSSTSLTSTSFHTPTTSLPGTPANPPFTPSLLLNVQMSKSTLPTDAPTPGGSTTSTTVTETPNAAGNPKADYYIELLAKLQLTAAEQLQEEHRHNVEERRSDHEQIARLENTLFDVVTKAECEKQERATPRLSSNRIDRQKFRFANGPPFKGPFHAIEPFLKWIHQLQIFFNTKDISHDDDKIYVAGGLLDNTILLDFYASEGASFIGKSWDDFKKRLFEVGLPQRWRTTLKSKLRQFSMGPDKAFITYSGGARTLQALINFDDSLDPSAAFTRLSDFDLAEYVVLGLNNELRADVAKFALLDVTPFVYSGFEKRVASFDEVIIRKTASRPLRTTTSTRPTSPDPIAWRVHAYLDSQGQCHHCKTTCGSAPGACTKPLNKRWVDIPQSFQTPVRPANYQPPKALSSGPNPAGKPVHPPAGRLPVRSALLAAINTSSSPDVPDQDHVDVVEALDADGLHFDAATINESLPPDLSSIDWAVINEINALRIDNIAGAEEDEASWYDSNYCSDLGCDPLDDSSTAP
ncbi:hypothetical protein Pst134EA_009655 [Puccinia striiformis f. sp. tritici]|uniref:hypothetical protein n=1 Tax=Puccinia striiformis f. sp. tritici TaxID=168172 RepID=UPI0020085F82|nr:hypothetical protein Pst134EA_009655 [Puccinia striiformis f. sp. tritici]KAH9469126.1 hypothetical protein Pst134EA_009655 [Puccinia striiformis f. sp. tritici]